MLNLLGEHPCRIDAKGRLMFPAKLRKQLDGVIHHGLVVNRDIFEGCLVLYPKPEWDKVNDEMARLSRYNRKHQLFQRKFMKGATHVDVDGAGRINLPAALLEYAGIDPKNAKEVIVSGLGREGGNLEPRSVQKQDPGRGRPRLRAWQKTCAKTSKAATQNEPGLPRPRHAERLA